MSARSVDWSTGRIIDANLNRAREALRVMEEYARFVLDDATLTAAVKNARHRLAAAIPIELATPFLACRETPGDVGTQLEGPGEYVRGGALDVAMAAGKRLSEALRSIEEYGKTIDREFAARIERLRYDGYDLEQKLAMIAGARERFGHIRLYVLITEALCRGDWFMTAQAALEGGADCLQLREKGLSDGELLARARRLSNLCHDRGAMFIMNDRPDLAVLAGADGVHVGQDDLAVLDARRVTGPERVVGTSTHTREQVAGALASTPGYIAVGPMFQSPTKPQQHIAGPATLAYARSVTALPLVAIGGITEENVEQVLAAADCCICVCGSVISRDDPRGAAARFRELMAEHRKHATESD